MKIVLFEGIDKVGKTTTINDIYNILEDYGFKPILLDVPFVMHKKTSRINSLGLSLSMNNISEMQKYFDDNYVCLIDRLHLSERVYGNVLRAEDLDNFTCNYIDYKLSRMNTLLVYIVPDDIKSNFNLYEEKGLLDSLTLEQYKKTYEKFNYEVDNSSIAEKMIIRKSNLNAENIIKEIVKM